ncbi:MAG TPA: ChpI protein [Terriglobia bacterium]|nr:ChpI protein [Terriglobia bacterium]
MKTAISIPDPLFKAAERVAKRQKISRSRLYSRAVQEYLERRRSKAIKKALDEVYAHQDSELDPGFAAATYEVLRKEKW